MLTEQTVDRLRTLRLHAIAEAYLTRQRDPASASLSFDERLGMLVDAEQLARENRALTRRLKEAGPAGRDTASCTGGSLACFPNSPSRMGTERTRPCWRVSRGSMC